MPMEWLLSKRNWPLINALATKSDVSKMVATLHKEGMAPFFALFVDADEKNSAMNIVQLYQAGIGMGDRDYYLLEDEGSAKMRDAYRAYINKLFTLGRLKPGTGGCGGGCRDENREGYR